MHASCLMRRLKECDAGAEFRAIGGDLMEREGAALLCHYRDMAYMGFLPVITHLGTILGNMDRCKRDIDAFSPDAVILVDYPGFNLKIARHVKRHCRIPVFYYISPKIWAWKTYRVKSIKKYVDGMFSILPFEKEFYDSYGYGINYVGNPTLNEVKAFENTYTETAGEFRRRHGLGNGKILALLAGSRKQEIHKNLPQMLQAAENLDFEQAEEYRQKMQSLEKHYSRSLIMNTQIGSVDVFSIVFDSNEAYGNFMRLRDGAVIQSLNLGFKMNIEEDQPEVLSMFIAEIQSKFGDLSKEVLVPFKPGVDIDGVEFRIPVRGDKLALLELSAKNAKEMRFNALKQKEHTDPDDFRRKVLEELRDALGMKELPVHIECFDNSNIQGTNPVASCVVFRDGVPSKKDYRHFNIKTVIGANDYASMKEVVNRRYSRMLAEAPDDLPQLIVIDGGKGQLSFAYEALAELGLTDRLTVVGLAKRLEEVIRVGDPYPLFIDRNSQALKVLQRIRDEAHRFGITHHRNRRSKAQIESALREIKGVGEKTEQRLILHYGSVARIAAASVEDLETLVGRDLAVKINAYFDNKNDSR